MKITSKTRLQGLTPEDAISPATETTLNKIPGLSIPVHDYIALSYTAGKLTGVVYKNGGSGGTTVATLTLTYDGDGNLETITKT